MDNFQSSILSDRLNTILKELKQMNQKLDRIIYRTSKRGFSLVELMIVVAVLGILAAIAIPNFQRFQARSRQTEAKAGLSAIHTAEHAFHAEWEVYAGALQPIGWVPDGKEFRYAIGFNAAQQGFCGANTNIAVAAMLNCGPAPGRLYRGNAENVGITLTGGVATTSYGGMSGGASVANEITFVGSDAAAATISDTTTDTANANEGMFTGTDAAPTGVSTDVDANFFTAGAVGNPRGYDSPGVMHFDYWLIDQEKNLDTRLGETLDEDL